jgi:TP901 family phage tail tape measure protein
MFGDLNVGTLRATLVLDDQFSSSFNVALRNIEQSNSKIQALGQRLENVGQTLSLRVTAPLVAAGGTALKFSNDFELGMTKVVTIAGESADNLAHMKQAVLDLVPAVGIGPRALADGLLVVESTGIKGAQAMEILERSAKASATGLGETKDIARVVTAAITAYGSENLSAAKATDVLFAAVKAGGAEANEFAGTLGRVIGIASQVGVSFEEVTGYMATFTRLGVDADEAATALRGTLSTILHPASQSREELDKLGLSIDQLRKNVKEKGLTEAMIELVNATHGNLDAIGTIIPNVRALAGVMGTAGVQAREMRDVLDQVKNSTGLLDEAFKRTADTGAFKWNQFLANAEKAAVAFGDKLAPAAQRALVAAQPLLDLAQRAVTWFGALPQPVQTGAIALLALAAAAGPVTYALGAILRVGAQFIEMLTWLAGTQGIRAVIALITNWADVIPIVTARLLALQGVAGNLGNLAGPIGAAARGFASLNLSTVATGGSTAAVTSALPALGLGLAAVGGMALYAWSEIDKLNKAHQQTLDQAKANADLLKQWQSLGGPSGIDPTKFDAATRARLAQASAVAPTALGIQLDLGGPAASGGAASGGSSVDALSTAIEKLKKDQAELIIQARAYAAFAGSDIAKLPQKVQEDYYGALQDVVDQYGSLKAAGLGSLDAVYDQLDKVVGRQRDAATAVYDTAQAIRLAKEQYDEATASALAETNAFLSIQSLVRRGLAGVPLPSPVSLTMPGIVSLHDIASAGGPDDPYRGMPKTTPSGEFIKPSVTQSGAFQFGGGLSNTIISAVSGGGDVLGSAGSYIGQQLGSKISTSLAKGSSFFASGIGAAMSGAIPVIGALAGPLLTSIVGVFKKGAYANDLRDSLKEKFGDAAGAGLQAFVDKLGSAQGVQEAYKRFMTAGSKEDVQSAFDDLTAAADKANATMQKYGLSLDDLQTPLQRVIDLSNEASQLKAIGFSDTQIGMGMADGLNAAIKAALDGQTKIPAALEPVLTAFVKGGGLADDLKNRILGLADPVPWQDMQSDAEFFGADITQLGDKFNNAKWSSVIADAGDKFSFLIDNGANAAAIIAGIDTNTNGVKDAIEGLVKSSLKFGTEIPANAKPMLQALADAGELTDDNGTKLTDLSKLTFGQDVGAQFQTIIDKLGTLIDRMSGPNGLYATINGIPQPQINWPPLPGSTFTPEQYATYQSSIGDPTKGTWVGNQWVPNQSQTPGFASGSAGLQRFSAAGTVALLHNEEEVLTRSQSEGVARMVARALAQGNGAQRTPTSVTHQWIIQTPDADGLRRLLRNPQFKREFVSLFDDNPGDFGVDVSKAIDRRLPS